MCARERAVGCCRRLANHGVDELEGAIGFIELIEPLGRPEACARRRERCRVHTSGVGRCQQFLPRGEAGRWIVEVLLLDLCDALLEERVARVAGMQALQHLEAALRLLLVPQIDPVQLVVRLAAQQRTVFAREQHVAQPLDPVTAGQQQQEAQEPGGSRRDIRVVLVETDPEARVVEGRVECKRLLERLLDPLAVASGRHALGTQHPPLHARAVGSSQVEPRFRAVRIAYGPRLGSRDRRIDPALELRVKGGALVIELDLPPESSDVEQLARHRGRRAAGPFGSGGRRVEGGVQNQVVDRGEAGGFGERRGRLGGSAGERRKRREYQPRARDGHTTLVRSRCLSAWRARASRMRRSSSAGYSRPLATQSFANMLMVVNPGMVFTSFTNS